MSMSATDFMKTLVGFMGGEGRAPKQKIHVLHPNASQLAGAPEVTDLVWFGHSAFLLQIDGKNILIDPMFGAVAGATSMVGASAFHGRVPVDDAASHDRLCHVDLARKFSITWTTGPSKS